MELTPPPTPFGAYVEAVKTGNLLFLSGMLPAIGHEPKFVGRLGKELDANAGREAVADRRSECVVSGKVEARVPRQGDQRCPTTHLSATYGDFFDQPKLPTQPPSSSAMFLEKTKPSVRMVLGVASLPLGMPVAVEVILEVEA